MAKKLNVNDAKIVSRKDGSYMKYKDGEIWSVKNLNLLKKALEGCENQKCDYYVDEQRVLPYLAGQEGVKIKGYLSFPEINKIIYIEEVESYGIGLDKVNKLLKEKNINYTLFFSQKGYWRLDFKKLPIVKSKLEVSQSTLPSNDNNELIK